MNNIKEDSAFGPGMMFGIPGPGPKRDTKGIPSDPKKEKGTEIKDKKKMKHMLKFEEFVNEELSTKEIDISKFPNPATKGDSEFFIKGKKDGDNRDDVVITKSSGIPAKSLKPSQDAVYLGKALGLAIAGVEGGELGAVISKDNRILDGHHRWAATIFNNPNAKIIGAKADLSIGDLIPVLRQAGDALGNERGTMPKGGDVNIFNATIKDVEDCIYKGINMDPKYFDKDAAVSWYEKNKSNVEKGLKMIQREGPPAGAPPRQEMPKIEPDQVDKIAKDLNAGKIDVRSPYNEGMKYILTFEEFVNESILFEAEFGNQRVVIFPGRFQPFHLGHIAALQKTSNLFQLPVVPIQILSKSDKSPFDDKLLIEMGNAVAKEYKSWMAGYSLFPAGIKTVIPQMVKYLRDQFDFEPVGMGCGSDRLKAYEPQIKYINSERSDVPVSEPFRLEMVDERAPGGPSGTRVREAIIADDKALFEQMTPKSIHKFYKDLKKSLS